MNEHGLNPSFKTLIVTVPLVGLMSLQLELRPTSGWIMFKHAAKTTATD